MNGMPIELIDPLTTPWARIFFLNTWPMYVHELRGYGADFYQLDRSGSWQPNVAPMWVARTTPDVYLRSAQWAFDRRQPFARAHVLALEHMPIGFACVAEQPFKYMPLDVDFYLAEFFVAHGQRGQGNGRAAVRQVLSVHASGRWYLEALAGNAPAQQFWSQALPAAGAVAIERGSTARSVNFRFSTQF